MGPLAKFLLALTNLVRSGMIRNIPTALKAAERAIALEPENHKHSLLKALVLSHTDRREEAAALIQQILAKAKPESDEARVAKELLGLPLMTEGDWDDAAFGTDEIYLADPKTKIASLRHSREAHLEKTHADLQFGAHNEAITAIDQAIAVYKDQTGQEALQQSTALRLLRARLLTQIGRFDQAITDLQNLTAQQSQNLEALIILASLYASVERWESLEAVIEPIAKRPELSDVALYLEGRATLAKNRVVPHELNSMPLFKRCLKRLTYSVAPFSFIADSAFKNLVVTKKPLLQSLTRSTLASVPRRVKKHLSRAASYFARIARVMPFRFSKPSP